MRENWVFMFLGILIWINSAFPADDVIINELNYNPGEDAPTEFVELYNPTGRTIDLSQYSFTDGIFFSFPPSTQIKPDEYIILVRYPDANAWRNKAYQIFGPYIDDLSDRGEMVRLRSLDGRIIDEVDYDDELPWARGADGYGPTLERIGPDLPSNDFHSWRASLNVANSTSRPSGSPGEKNSVTDVLPKPVIVDWDMTPKNPASTDTVRIEITLDGAELVDGVTLLYETVFKSVPSDVQRIRMDLERIDDDRIVYRTDLPAQESETLVRMAVEVQRVGGGTLDLPHRSEPRPFESYFVFDRDIPSLLPIIWMHTRISTKLPSRVSSISGVVIKEATEDNVQVYDGANIVSSRNGQKIRFLKHEEYQDNRTLNVIPEKPTGSTTSGLQAPFVEDLSHQIFRDFGIFAPYVYWFRVIDKGNHSQRILIQQPNEKFLDINGRDPSGNIYKIAYNEPGGYTKMTNVNEGDDDYIQLLNAINWGSESDRRTAIHRYLNVEEVMQYSVAGVLMSNWDGFFNNMFLHHDLQLDQWECIPWDLDKTFGYTDGNPMFVEMPVNFPLDGRSPTASRPAGTISGPFHRIPEIHEEYTHLLRSGLDGLFSIERIFGMIETREKLLMDDLKMQEDYTRKTTASRIRQIETSYDTMRTFMELRHEFLLGVLPEPVSVSNWPLY